MAQISGSDIAVGLYHEDAWGVTNGSPAGQVGYVESLGVSANQNLVESAVISGGRGVQRPGLGNIQVAGSLRTELAPENIGFYLTHLLGTATTSGSDPYTHVFVPAALPEGFQVEKDYTSALASKVEVFKGCRMASGTFSFPQEGFCKAEFSIAGRERAVVTAALDASQTDPGHNGFTGFEGTLKQGGTALASAQSGTLVVDNSVRSDLFTFSSAGLLYSLPEGRAKISGEIQFVFEDFTLIDLATAHTETTLEFIVTRGDGLGSAGNESISFLVDHMDFSPTSPPLETESGIQMSMQYQGFASGADMGLEVTLKNAVAAANL